MSFSAPAAVRSAFEETLHLYRALSGHEETVTSFIEALVAEAFAGPHPPDAVALPLRTGVSGAIAEHGMAVATERWSLLRRSVKPDVGPDHIQLLLRELEAISAKAGTGAAADLDYQIRTLAALESRVERELGAILAEMAERGAWGRLLFSGTGHYAEERLGLARTSAEDRARLARTLGRFAELRDAYEAGVVGFEAALITGRALERTRASSEIERAWVTHAAVSTIKRLRDEARTLNFRLALGGARVDDSGAPRFGSSDLDPRADCLAGVTGSVSHRDSLDSSAREVGSRGAKDGGCEGSHAGGEANCSCVDLPDAPSPGCGAARPMDDAAWHASLRRGRGDFLARVELLSRLAAAHPVADGFLRLRLPEEMASDLLSAIASAGRELERRVDQVPWHDPWPDPDPPGTVLAARTFSNRCRRAPAWVGFLALLEDFARTWDPPTASRMRREDSTHVRDGWRCAAPGCTSRRNLEEHHVVYRARGGGDEMSNRICLCRFHHQQGEHGGLAACRGMAPLGIVWRLGRDGIAGTFRNERRVDAGTWNGTISSRIDAS